MGRKAREKSQRTTTDGTTAGAAAATQTLPTRGAASDRRQTALIAAVLVALVVVIFAQLRSHQFLNYDDDIYITANDHVKSGLTAAGVRWAFTSPTVNWHPVTWLSHMLDVDMFGVHAGPHLMVNALLHAANSVLLLLLLARATGLLWRSSLVAALFAVHPLHVESVAWLSERKDVLSTLFFLLTLYLYVRFCESRSKWTYVALTVTFILGLMSKGMLVTLPFVLLLLDFWPLRRLRSFEPRAVWKVVLEKLPLFVLVIPAVAVTYQAQRGMAALADPRKVGLPARLANAAISYVAYIGKMFWPAGLAIPYPYRVVISPTGAVLSVAILIAITAAAILTRRSQPWFFTGWFWFVGMLVPVIGLVQIGIQSMADRYTYVPLIGLFIVMTWLAAELVERWPQLRPAAWIVAVLLVAILTFAARLQAGYWKDSETLFRHSVANTHNNVDAHLTLGIALLNEKKDAAAAAREFEAAIAIFPSSAPAHHDLAAASAAMGRLDDASREYRRAIELDPSNERRYRELATVETRRGRKTEAARLLTRSAAMTGDPAAQGAVALERGDLKEALAKYADAIRIAPASAEVRNDFAGALAKAGRDDEALRQYQEALRLKPSLYDAHMNIGALLSRRDRNDEAIAHFSNAAAIQPQSTEPHVYLALALAQAGRRQDAVREAKAAMAIDPAVANDQFTAAVRMPPKPDNLRQFIASLGTGSE
jgi:protein O-mannosyl-transferase